MGKEFRSVEIVDLKAQVSKILQQRLCELMQEMVLNPNSVDVVVQQVQNIGICRDTLALDWRNEDS